MTHPDPTSAGAPEGMSADDVEGRSELASCLGKEVWPADASRLLAKASESNAPEKVLRQLRSLPAGRQFQNASDVWQALHGGVEQHRF
jgi:Protein of unknown function (DUF2795)